MKNISFLICLIISGCSTQNIIVEEGTTVIIDKCKINNLTSRFECVIIGEYILKNNELVKNK